MPLNTKWAGAAGLLAAGALAGGILAGTMSANADTGSGSATTSSSYGAGADPGDGDGRGGGHAGETALTGTEMSTATAAAEKAVPGGTVVRAETDSGDAVYEVHMTKSDGTDVTVKLAKDFTLTTVEDGMGK
jgi:hypothetical protein